MAFFGLFRDWSRISKKQTRPIQRRRNLVVEVLENRLVPSTFAEVEINNTIATANAVTIATGDVLTTSADDWLTITGAITAADNDFFQFTIGTASGVFFDIDSFDIGLSATLNSTLSVFDSASAPVPGGNNNNGYDFQGFAAPTSSVPGAASPDSSLYLDLAPGTYTVRVAGFMGTTGAYQLRLLADSSYTSSVPTFNSSAGAADTLFLDFNGQTSTNDIWTTYDTQDATPGVQANGPYTATAFDFNGNAGQFSPAERLAIYNVWRVASEDFSSFKINVSTASPASFNNGAAFRMVLTNSDSVIIGQPTGNLGVTFVGSYALGSSDNVSFTFCENFATFGDGGISGIIVARALEQGNTASHEFGHALGLQHYASIAGNAGPADLRPDALMATLDIGLNREIWAAGKNEIGVTQDDMAIISNTTNTLGYRLDDYGGAFATASTPTPASSGYFNKGLIAPLADRDFFRFVASGDTTITVDVDEYVNNLDVELRLYNSAGVQIAIDDALTSFDARLVMPALAAGTYYLDVRSDGEAAEAGSYTLKIDTVLTTVIFDGNNTVVTDIASGGKADQLTISAIGGNFRIHDPNNALSAGPGLFQVDTHTVDVRPALIGFPPKGVIFNTLGGNDFLTDAASVEFLTYNGGAGVDTFVGANVDTIWRVTGVNTGKTEIVFVQFAGVENLTGGSGRDLFRFVGVGAITGKIDGGAGVNWLDFTSASTGVVVNLATNTTSRTAGGILGFNNVIGSALGVSKLTGNATGGVLIGKGKGNVVTAGSGRSVLIGGFGVNTLIGGGADDLLINGRTIYDANLTALEAILAIWQNAGQTYEQRIAALQAAGPNQLRVGTTVFLHPGLTPGGIGPRVGSGNFVYLSSLFGKAGQDWFITKSPRTVFDGAVGEVVTT